MLVLGASGCTDLQPDWFRDVDSPARAGAAEPLAPDDLATLHQAAEVCPDGPTLPGIDVSHWQGDIDWEQVAGAGIVYAFIRVSDGTGTRDREFAYNWAEAQRVGILRGAYQFFRPAQDARAQAELFLEIMGDLEEGDLPPVIDVEDTGGLGGAAIAAKIATWIEIVEARTGLPPIIYSGLYFWKDNVGSAAFVDYPLWLAQYRDGCPTPPAPWTRWTFWQNSSSGRVAGIGGDVDTDIFNGDEEALLDLTGARAECGDGRCNGGETHATCPGDCPVCEPIPAAGRIVDETDLCFAAGGPAQYWRVVTGAGYGGRLLWTHTTDHDDRVNYAAWTLEPAVAGNYRLEVYTDEAYARSTRAGYRVIHAGREDRIQLDQTAVHGWNPLGTFDFVGGAGQAVELDDNTGEPGSLDVQLVADALRMTRVDPGEGEGEGSEGEGEGSEGEGEGSEGEGEGSEGEGEGSEGEGEGSEGEGEGEGSEGEGEGSEGEGEGCEGEGEGSEGEGEGGEGEGEGERLCEPGRSVACICLDGSLGAKQCANDGQAWSVCICAGGEGEGEGEAASEDVIGGRAVGCTAAPGTKVLALDRFWQVLVGIWRR
ncbi:MAG: GH25 family lysozyme [Myxococcota bacterium]|nr:GH25 family lysozyme [Myxococcota bacterium]